MKNDMLVEKESMSMGHIAFIQDIDRRFVEPIRGR
jgi:hypothetical protein